MFNVNEKKMVTLTLRLLSVVWYGKPPTNNFVQVVSFCCPFVPATLCVVVDANAAAAAACELATADRNHSNNNNNKNNDK